MRTLISSNKFLWSASAVLVLGSYLLVALHSIAQPAIYLDEINPDYLAVRMLNPATHTDAWMPPARYFNHRFLLLLSPYAGAMHAYLQAPFYYLFGGHIESFRYSHVFLGIFLLTVFYLSVARITKSLSIATLSSLVLAIDPAFVFAFRTQGFMQLFPTVFTVLGVVLCCAGQPRPRRLILAGICFGFSVWGYFIFGFSVPGLLLAVLLQDHAHKWRRGIALIGGIAVGSFPLIFGYIDAYLAFGNWPPMLQWMRGVAASTQRAYHPSGTSSAFQIIASNANWVMKHCWTLLTSEWIWQVIFGLLHKDPGQYVKAALLLLIPVAALIYDRMARPADREVHNTLVMTLLAIGSYLVVCSFFGGLLLSHHYHPILFLCYFATSIGSAVLLPAGTRRKALVLVPVLAILVSNALQDRAVLLELHDLGGRSYYSHIVTDYAVEEANSKDMSDHVFMDWGGMLQFIYLTEGRIPTHDVRVLTTWGQVPLRKALCGLGEVKLVFIGDGADIRAPQYVQSEQLPVHSVRSLRDERQDFEYVIVQTQPTADVCNPGSAAAAPVPPAPAPPRPTATGVAVAGLVAPGFEDGTLAPWVPYGNVQTSVDHEAAHSGKFGLEEKSGDGSVWQDVSGLQPGSVYTISAWLSASDDQSVGRFAVYNPATGQASFSDEFKPGKTWQQVRYSVRLDKGDSLKIHLWRRPGNGTVYWDDVQISKDQSK